MILKCFAGGLDLKDTVVMPRDILCLPINLNFRAKCLLFFAYVICK